MNKKVSIIFIALLLVSVSTSISTVSAADYSKVGVHVGSTWSYQYAQTVNASIITTRMDVSVSSINSTLVWLTVDGSHFWHGNISSAFSLMYLWLIVANLSAGDKICSDSLLTLGSISNQTVLGVSREVYSVQSYGKYDRLTGIMIAWGTAPGDTYILIATNLWGNNGSAMDIVPIALVTVAIAIATCISLIVIKRRSSKVKP